MGHAHTHARTHVRTHTHTHIHTHKVTHFNIPMRSCNRYDLTTGTSSAPLSENGVKDFVEVLLLNIH